MKNLYGALKVHLTQNIEDLLLCAMAIFLETESCGLMELEEILENIEYVIVER